jgi:hypothetical protein
MADCREFDGFWQLVGAEFSALGRGCSRLIGKSGKSGVGNPKITF